MPVVNAQGPNPVADEVSFAGEHDDGAGGAGDGLREGCALREGEGGGGVDAALLDDGGG